MILRQKFIYRDDLQNNPMVKYLFGDNLERRGYGGQAKEMRNEPNAIGIATKREPSMADSAFFNDDQYHVNVMNIMDDFAPAIKHLLEGGTLVIPSDGLGTGLSDLPNRAPRTYKALEDIIDYLYDLDRRTNQCEYDTLPF